MQDSGGSGNSSPQEVNHEKPSTSTSTPTTSSIRSKRKKEEDLLRKSFNILDNPDEDQIFGDFVASSLRNLKDGPKKKS